MMKYVNEFLKITSYIAQIKLKEVYNQQGSSHMATL